MRDDDDVSPLREPALVDIPHLMRHIPEGEKRRQGHLGWERHDRRGAGFEGNDHGRGARSLRAMWSSNIVMRSYTSAPLSPAVVAQNQCESAIPHGSAHSNEESRPSRSGR